MLNKPDCPTSDSGDAVFELIFVLGCTTECVSVGSAMERYLHEVMH